MTITLLRPGAGLKGFDPILPVYPFRYEDPQIGDEVWFLYKDSTGKYYIECDTISERFDFRDDYINTPEMARGHENDDWAIDFRLNKHDQGFPLSFGIDLYSTYEEARGVILQICSEDERGKFPKERPVEPIPLII